VASRATRGPTAPPPRMHPPRRCSRVVVGRLLRPFRPAAQHCKPILSPRGDASPSVLGTRPPSAAHIFCALCIEIAALCIVILALCIEMVMLLPSALKSQRCASKSRHSVSTLLHYASKFSWSSILHHNRSVLHRNCGTVHRYCCIMHRNGLGPPFCITFTALCSEIAALSIRIPRPPRQPTVPTLAQARWPALRRTVGPKASCPGSGYRRLVWKPITLFSSSINLCHQS